jgi:glutathione peroxidase
MKKLKRFTLVIVLLLFAFAGYVEIVNRNSENMNYRQKVLKAVYPAWMWFTKLTGKNVEAISNENKRPIIPFHSLNAVMNNGEPLHFEQLKGKKVLIVNTASNCGYTHQYEELQKLYEQYKNKLVILGFPANDFKEQEKGSDEEIAAFCKLNYGVSFPLMKKSVVIKNGQQHPVYQWLTDSSRNGWNQKAPSWNFSKYLIDEEGVLRNYFDPSVSPLSAELINSIEKN